MLKRSIILSLIFLSAKAMDNSQMSVSKSSLQMSHKLGALALARDNNGFHVFEGNKKTTIKSYDVDPMLRTMNPEQFKAFQKVGYLTLKQLSNKDYKLNAHVRGNGGASGGATAGVWVGWTVTNVLGHGTIFLACRAADMVVPGSGTAAETGLHIAAAPAITATAKAIAIASGIFFGTLTGPV